MRSSFALTMCLGLMSFKQVSLLTYCFICQSLSRSICRECLLSSSPQLWSTLRSKQVRSHWTTFQQCNKARMYNVPLPLCSQLCAHLHERTPSYHESTMQCPCSSNADNDGQFFVNIWQTRPQEVYSTCSSLFYPGDKSTRAHVDRLLPFVLP